MQRHGPRRISHEQEDRTNGAYGSRTHGGHRSDRDDTVIDGRFLDTLKRRRDRDRYYSSSDLDRHYDHHHYHPYRRSDSGYLPDEFKKAKPPTFDGEMKKPQVVEAWFLGMRKFFRLHNYLENMKDRVATFSLKGKADISWEDVKNLICIHEEDLNWSEFTWLFKNMYLSMRYFDDRPKEFYELKMGSMTDDEYTSRFLELLRYVPYLMEEKAKIQSFISGLLVASKRGLNSMSLDHWRRTFKTLGIAMNN